MASTANSSTSSSSFNNNNSNKKTVVVPSVATSSSTTTLFNNNNNNGNHSSTTQEVTHLKTEMKELKQRVASMATNIDELTDMVKKVSVKECKVECGGGALLSSVISPGAEWEEVGNKRKKMATTAEAVRREEGETDDVIMKDLLPIMPDWTSSSDFATAVDDSLLLSGDTLPDLAVSSTSPSPAPSDDTFVDDLFQAFADEDAILPGLEGVDESNSKAPHAMEEEDTTTNNNNNKPDPQLMKRIEDSLSTIPRDMHELVANRLIDAIADTKPIVESASSLGIFPSISRQQQGTRSRSSSFGSTEGENCKKKADRSISLEDENMENGAATTKQAQADNKAAISSSIPLPVAVSALKTILAEYGVSVECRSSCKNAESRFTSKSLPVIPMHA